MKVNLEKSKEVVVNLIKDTEVEGVKARVVLAIDYSISMSFLYNNGTVQKILERIMPIAMTFDDNESLEVFKFHEGSIPVNKEVTPSNYKTFVEKCIMEGSMGGTKYAPVMKDIVGTSPVKSGGLGGFIKNLFTKKSDTEEITELPTYVIFITDGDCFDTSESLSYIKEVSNKPIFWQFVGIGNSSFKTLEELDTMRGRVIDNANFFSIRDTKEISTMSDQDLLGKLLTEFPSWYKEAKEKNIVK